MKEEVVPVEDMSTEVRQIYLADVQRRLQVLWNKIEYRELVAAVVVTDPWLTRLKSQFEELEIEERRLIVPGFPITPKRKGVRHAGVNSQEG